jgi:hypothetical protein
MNDTNWDEYDDELLKQDIIDIYFDDTAENKCKIKIQMR